MRIIGLYGAFFTCRRIIALTNNCPQDVVFTRSIFREPIDVKRSRRPYAPGVMHEDNNRVLGITISLSMPFNTDRTLEFDFERIIIRYRASSSFVLVARVEHMLFECISGFRFRPARVVALRVAFLFFLCVLSRDRIFDDRSIESERRSVFPFRGQEIRSFDLQLVNTRNIRG